MVQAELQDLIVASTYGEVWVGCERADKVWWVECEAMRTAIGGDVEVWYALMGLSEGEVGGDGGVDLEDVRRMVEDARAGRSRPNGEGVRNGRGGGGKRDTVEQRVRRMRCPYLGQHTIAAVDRELRHLQTTMSGREKLECIGRVRGILFACMSNAAMISLRRRKEAMERRTKDEEGGQEGGEDGEVGTRNGVVREQREEDGGEWLDGDVEVGSVDDYMCLLSFLLLHLNPYGLLSHLSFLRLLHTPSASYKPFVDAVTAVKALFAMQNTLAPWLTYPDAVLARARMGGRGVRGGEGEGGGGSGGGGVGRGGVTMVRSVSQPNDVVAGGKAQLRSHSSLAVHAELVPPHS